MFLIRTWIPDEGNAHYLGPYSTEQDAQHRVEWLQNFYRTTELWTNEFIHDERRLFKVKEIKVEPFTDYVEVDQNGFADASNEYFGDLGMKEEGNGNK